MTAPNLAAEPAFQRIKERIIDETGLAYYRDKDHDLAARLRRRLAALGMKTCSEYSNLLDSAERGAAEMDDLVSELTIGETHFFRHPPHFEALRRHVFPGWFAARSPCRPRRVWCAGCATGAEVYSLAILLRREFPEASGVTLIGTDINHRFLARAVAGVYDDWSFRDCPDDIRESCFTREGRLWRIKPEYRSGVSFIHHNLARHSLPSPAQQLDDCDLIVCRNVAIYFDRVRIVELMERLSLCLAPGGFLLTGFAEVDPSQCADLIPVSISDVLIFQKPPEGGESDTPARRQAALPDAPAARSAGGETIVQWIKQKAIPIRIPEHHRMSPEQSPAVQDGAPGLDTDLARIRRLIDSGDIESAAALCQERIAREALSPVLHYYYALVLDQAGQPAAAAAFLGRALYLDRAFVPAHYLSGLLARRMGDRAVALRSFRNVLSLLDGLPADRVFTEIDDIRADELRELAAAYVESQTEEAIRA